MGEISDIPTSLGGLIPNFFFDVIGRVIPGTFLLLGILWSRHAIPANWFSDGFAKATVGGLVFVFLGALTIGYLVGSVLGSASHWLESWMSKKKEWRWSLPFLRKEIGESEDQQTRLERLFRDQFGYDITDDNIEECSWLCYFFLWAANPRLGSMSGRWDAEALAARSISIAAFIIMALTIITDFPCLSRWPYDLLFLIVSVVGADGYRYHRKMRMLGRFKLFVSMPRNTVRLPK